MQRKKLEAWNCVNCCKTSRRRTRRRGNRRTAAGRRAQSLWAAWVCWRRRSEDIAALTGDAQAPLLPRAVLVLCADNGVVAQGVTQTDSSVTAAGDAQRWLRGAPPSAGWRRPRSAPWCPWTWACGILPPQPGVLARRIGNGTGDITQGPAMTRAQAEQAVLAGAELVRTQKDKGRASAGHGRDGHRQHHHGQRCGQRAAGPRRPWK